MARVRRTRTLPERQWDTLAALVRLAARFGQWPSSGELAREMRVHKDTVRAVLKSLRADGLAYCTKRGNDAGWVPTAEGLHWRGLSLPRLEACADAPPRAARWAGVGAVRAWNRRQRLKARIAAAQVFDRDAVSDGGEFEG